MITQPKLWTPRPTLYLPAQGLSVRFKTELCDSKGRVIRELQRGRNVITDFGMDSLDASGIGTGSGSLIDYLNLGSATETLKRVASGEVLTVTYTDAATITLTTDTNFFEAGDVGRTFKINGGTPWPEMEITGYTSEQEVAATARAGVWLPGFTPGASPVGSITNFGVHYTNKATLGTEFTRFNSLDTAASDNKAELNDSSNSRFIQQRIFLSGAVTGSAWTVNQLGWSNNSSNCFGKVNLGSPDTVPVGNKYRVTLQVMDAFTPIDLTGVSLDWGATIGTHTCDVRQERIWKESQSLIYKRNFLNRVAFNSGDPEPAAWTSAFTMANIEWEGDAGFDEGPHGFQEVICGNSLITDAAYTSGEFTKIRTIRWPDTVAITNGTALGVARGGGLINGHLSIKPQSGTITKPTGYWMELAFPIHWARELVN